MMTSPKGPPLCVEETSRASGSRNSQLRSCTKALAADKRVQGQGRTTLIFVEFYNGGVNDFPALVVTFRRYVVPKMGFTGSGIHRKRGRFE